MKRKLPHGIQDFAKLRQGGNVYVDKTDLIYQLITESESANFFSRPRRFGKSLLCTTIEAIFQGRRELFQEIAGKPGLAIDKLDWEWKKYPVILLALNSGEYLKGVDGFRGTLHYNLLEIANTHNINLRGEDNPDKFKFLIKDLHEKYNEKVVIIIDEYDKPLLETVDNEEVHIEFRKILKGFYGILKEADEFLRFAFITGVTKFSQASIFSDLNHLMDLTFDTDYASLCGLTQAEVEKNFKPEIDMVLKNNTISKDEYIEELQAFYDGYRFTEKDIKVFNPFGLLHHFHFKGKFSPYWYNTGSPTFLIKLVKSQKIDITDLQNKRVAEDDFVNFDIENLSALPILYQSGYLTISEYDSESKEYILDFPNLEVRSAFSRSLLSLINPDNSEVIAVKLITSAFIRGEAEKVLMIMRQFIASTPYDIIKNTENFYHTVFHLIFSILGLDCRSEVRIVAGRIDTIVQTKKHIYCFEFKLDGSAEEALTQIDTKEYMIPFENKGKQLFKIGVNFNSEKRNIDDWKIKTT